MCVYVSFISVDEWCLFWKTDCPGIKYFVLKLHISKCVRSVSMYNSYRLQLNKQTWNYILQSTYWFHWWLECILCTPRYTQTHWWKLVITICTGHIGILHQHETCWGKKKKIQEHIQQTNNYLIKLLITISGDTKCACFVDRCLSFCPLSFAIMLSVLRRFMDSDYLPLVSSNSCSYMMPYLTGVATQSVVFPWTNDRITRTPLKPGRAFWIVLLHGLVKHFIRFHPIFRCLNLIFPP
jgi:hypothetical protein